jgi:1,4-dihydroxy-2-naphthoyl-CoA hydrolase
MDLDYQYDHSPFDRLLGLRLEEASGDRVVAVLPVTADLHQNDGTVHGGVYTTAVEATASVGADLWLSPEGRVVGLSNDTEVRRAVRTGKLRIEATPLERGRDTQLWQAAITDERDRLVAHGRVLLMNLRKGPKKDEGGVS